MTNQIITFEWYSHDQRSINVRRRDIIDITFAK